MPNMYWVYAHSLQMQVDISIDFDKTRVQETTRQNGGSNRGVSCEGCEDSVLSEIGQLDVSEINQALALVNGLG